jgi:hypothetical protein
LSIAAVVCLVAVGFQPLLKDLNRNEATAQQTPNEIPAAFRDLSRFVQELMENTDDTNLSDSDGLPDSVELVTGTDPLNPDSDFDGVNDHDEAFMGMDPNKADSNDDRFADYREVTDVGLDLDGDGLPDLEEQERGTNLTNWDTDGDGLSDGFELASILSPL